jgi:hypothetical protein
VRKNSSVAVVYLARHSDGLAAFKRFAGSYRRHSAGIDHDLLIIYKGFKQQRDLGEARAVFSEHAHEGIELEDIGFDIGSYLECSRRTKQDYLCFVNTHSEVAATGWLALLHNYAARSGVGVVGAMGSYESLKQSWELIHMFRWLYYAKGLPLGDAAARYYVKFPEYLGPMRTFLHWRKLLPARFLGASYRKAHARFGAYWRMILNGEPHCTIAPFPNFPNPHIRSNGFMVRRGQLALFDGVAMATKDDACYFESGPNSLTAQVRRAGQAAILVGRNGQGYDVAEWPSSQTFRLGDESNLLIADNHSRAFLEMTPENRITHARMTWGDYLGPLPDDYPTLGIAFARGSLHPCGGDVSTGVRQRH